MLLTKVPKRDYIMTTSFEALTRLLEAPMLYVSKFSEVELGGSHVHIVSHANDIILLSQLERGLQRQSMPYVQFMYKKGL